MKVIKNSITLFIALFIYSFNHTVYADDLYDDSILLKKEINQAAQQKISNPVEYVLNKYISLNKLITFSINSENIVCDSENNGDNAYIQTKNLKKPPNLPNKQWQAFLQLTHDPIDAFYSGGDLDITFFQVEKKGYIGLLITVPNMGSAAGAQFLFYILNKQLVKYTGLTDHDDNFFIGQKGDDNDIFFINFHEKHYVIYRNSNDYSLYDFFLYNTNSLLNNNKNSVETLHFTYNYKYKIKQTLDHKQAASAIGQDFIDEANLDTTKIVPVINHQLNLEYSSASKDCINKDPPAGSSYVEIEPFTFKFQNICYYSTITCPLNDPISSCTLEVFPNGQEKEKVFELEKKRYLKISQ